MGVAVWVWLGGWSWVGGAGWVVLVGWCWVGGAGWSRRRTYTCQCHVPNIGDEGTSSSISSKLPHCKINTRGLKKHAHMLVYMHTCIGSALFRIVTP